MTSNTPPEGFPEDNLPLEDENQYTVGYINTPISNKAYDALKMLALVILPAFGALYFGLAEIWGLPKAQEVVGTITVVDTFLGVLLAKLGGSYKEQTEGRMVGTINVADTAEKLKVDMNFPGNAEQILRTQDKVTFKIQRN